MTQITNVYAEALFALTCESGQLEESLSALQEIRALLSDNPELGSLLSSPAIPVGERVNTAKAVFGESTPEHVLSFLCLLCEKKQVGIFDACVREYERLWEQYHALSVARVTVAVPMSEEKKEALRVALEKKSGRKVRLDCRVDPAILGGVIVEMDGTLTDGSLRHRLQQVKEELKREP